ncbi:unnamed protein product [Strongylus vulgaris]|uniref:G-protein coupled receptors family 1 profile domain-containing protein n=1 Tax=Strongylus vulgaris TaxID=40348 RepID=A0A3P7LCQ0_STRVU|nr:unnamed protein product [Strongylus vulgaris]
MNYCELDPKPTYYITTMHVLSALTIPVDLFGIYFIVSKTPSIMKEYSRFLLYYQVCATVADIWTNLLFIPVMFLPFPIGYTEGLLYLCGDIDIFYFFVVWYSLVVTTMGSNYSCIQTVDGIPGIRYSALSDIKMLFLIVTAEAFFAVTFSYLFIYLTFLPDFLDDQLSLQVTSPILIVIIPGCSVMLLVCWGNFSGGAERHVQMVVNMVFIMIATHGFFGTIVMIAVNEPYRRTIQDAALRIVQIFRRRRVEPID